MLIGIKITRNVAFYAQVSLECYFFSLINVKMPTIVGILTYMSNICWHLTCMYRKKFAKLS